jgi:SAM-dependent methyltransferase
MLIPYRGRKGTDVYAAGMEAGAADKAKLLRFVRPGVIADLGCGAGAVLELLRKQFPKSHIMGADTSEEMVRRCRDRFPGLEVRRHDITARLFDDKTVDTVILCSVLHEVYSYSQYDLAPVRQALRVSAEALKPGGRLIFRDGLRPAREDNVYMSFLSPAVKEKFLRFAWEFGPGPVTWEERDGNVRLSRRDAMEFLSKYIYDANWKYEVMEVFGVFSLKGWVEVVERFGLRVIHRESYLIDWLRVNRYEKDVRLEVRRGQRFVPTDYPHSTMILVAEKP